MKHLHKESIIWLLIISFISAVASDLIYGKIALAKEYAIGIFIVGISQLTFSLATIFIILYLLFRVIFKDFFEMMFYNSYPKSKTPKRGSANK